MKKPFAPAAPDPPVSENVMVWFVLGLGCGSLMVGLPQALVSEAVVVLGLSTFTAALIERQM
jgi:hypothetical protein